jgi:hypothetical protein
MNARHILAILVILSVAFAANETNATNDTGQQNATAGAGDTGIISGTVKCLQSDPIKCFTGNWGLLIGAAVLIVAAFIIFVVLKQVVLNAIFGIIALLVIVYVFGVPIPLSPLVMLVSVLGGVGGVAAVLIATFFGWL